MKRLLLIGTSVPERLEDFYRRAFSKLGIEVTLYDPDWMLRRLHSNRILNRLSRPVQHLVSGRALLDFYRQPRWDAVLVVKGYTLAPEFIAECRRRASVPWANFNPDSPFDPGTGTASPHIRAAIPEYDLYFIWSQTLLETLRAAGCRRPRYLPFAHDELSHRPALETDASLSGLVTLVGTYDLQRAAVMESIADLPVRIFGGGWERLSRSSSLRGRVFPGGVFGDDLRRVVSSSLACLNILRPQNAGAHNMRTFEVPAMGGIALSSRSAEQHAFFPEGEASLMFGSTEELRTTIASLVDHRIDTDGMRRRALELSTPHTYLQRARAIVEELASL